MLEARTSLRLWCLLHLGAWGWSCLPEVARGSASVRASCGGYLALELVHLRLSPFWFLFPCSLEKLSLCTAPTTEGVMGDVMTAREGWSPPANRKCLAASDPSFWLSPLATWRRVTTWGALGAAGIRDREEVEKMGAGVPLRTSPGTIVLCLSVPPTGPNVSAVP